MCVACVVPSRFWRDEIGGEGRWKWRSRWSERDDGMNDGSVCVTTRVGTYLNLLIALRNSHFVRGRRVAEIGAGVARMT